MEVDKSKSFFQENAISISAIVVSFCALFVSFYQTSIMREQQYASVRPLIIMGNSMGSNDEDSTGYFKLLVWNKGIGPALIKYVDIEYKGQHYSEFDFSKIVNKMMNRPEAILISSVTSNATASAVGTGEEITMFEMNDKKLCFAFIDAYTKSRRQDEFNATIYFTDVYDRFFKISMNGQQVFPSSKQEIMAIVPENLKSFIEF